MSDSPTPSTLKLTFLWLILGPGLFMPFFFLAPGFLHPTGDLGDTVRIIGSILFFIVSVAVLIPMTWRYKKGSPKAP